MFGTLSVNASADQRMGAGTTVPSTRMSTEWPFCWPTSSFTQAKAVTLSRVVASAETRVHSYTLETKMEYMAFQNSASPAEKFLRQLWVRERWYQPSLGTCTGSLTLISRRMVTAVTYQATVQHLQEKIGRRRSRLLTRGVLLLHDNSRSHTALWTPGVGHMFTTHHAAPPWSCRSLRVWWTEKN